MDICNSFYSGADIPIPGGSEFVWQCIAFLAREDLLIFTSISLMVLLLAVIFKDLMEVLEDGSDRKQKRRNRHKQRDI